jgi:ATP-dependent protease HslVU (ClpYQ) peptidase subunit
LQKALRRKKVLKQLEFLVAVLAAISVLPIEKVAAGNVAEQDVFYFGVESGFGSQKGGAVVDIGLLKAVGFNSFRTPMWWDGLERHKRGVFTYDWSTWDRYIKDRYQFTPSKASPAPLLTLLGDNKRTLAGGFKYGAPFPPDGNPLALEGYLDYVRKVVRRYMNSVPIFEVWNEWYHGAGSGARDENTSVYALEYGATPCSQSHPYKYCWTESILRRDGKVVTAADGKYINQSPTMPEHYIKLLKPTYEVVKRFAPDSKVIATAGSLADLNWMKRFVEAGGLNYIDGVSIHVYWDGTGGRKYTPEWALQRLDIAQLYLKELMSIRTKKPKSQLSDIPFYITEVGISTFDNDYSGEKGQARAANELIRFLFAARSRSYIKGIWIFALRDRDNPIPRERNFGLFDIDLQSKVTARELQRHKIVDALIDGSDFFCTIDGRPCQYDGIQDDGKYTQLPDGSKYVISWQDKSGKRRRAEWSKGLGAKVTIY